jgi:hypothetical protein
MAPTENPEGPKLLKGHFMLFGQLPPFNIRGARLGSIWDSSEAQWNKLTHYYKTITNLLSDKYFT